MASVVVVGGGVAGLVCGWRLRRAGHDVEVLEVERTGGRLVAEQRGDFRIGRGATFITEGQRNVVSIAMALGLTDDLVWLDSCEGQPNERRGGESGSNERRAGSVPGAILHRNGFEACDLGRWREVLRSSLLPTSSKLRWVRLAAEVRRYRDYLDPRRPERAARLEDGEELQHFAARVVGETARDRLLGPALSTLLGCEPEDLSGAFGLLVLRSLGQGAAPITWAGGLARLTERLAEGVPVRTGCEVFSVETEKGGARIRYRGAGRERTAVADAAVVAVPGPVVPLICPDLTRDERNFFGSARYAPGIQVHVLLDEAPTGLAAFALAIPRDRGTGLRAVFQSHREPGVAPEGAGLLTLSLAEPAVRRLAQSKDEEIAGFSLDALARTPIGRLEPIETIVHRFPNARPVFPRGALSRLEAFGVRPERSPRLVFAGDYLIGPTVDGAITSGMQAASRVVQGL